MIIEGRSMPLTGCIGAAWAQTDATSADARPTTIAILDLNDTVELLFPVFLNVTPHRAGAALFAASWSGASSLTTCRES
jgi:hypothetical protein